MRRDVVCVIGAGPYGLTAAAYLRAAGLDVRIFGEVMSFWRSMPCGMLLRSTREGISLSDPELDLSIDDYEHFQNANITTPVDRAEYIRYVEWYQRAAVPFVDSRRVTEVVQREAGFRVTLDDGDSFDCARVVVAVGLDPFKRKLPVLSSLPPEVAPHSFDDVPASEQRGKRVMVVGSGQSALESVAMLRAAGADVELVSRGAGIHWLSQSDHINRERSLWTHLLYPPGALGPPGINWIVQTPSLFRALPGAVQRKIFDRTVRPAVSGRLRTDAEQVKRSFGTEVTSAEMRGRQVRVSLNDGSERLVDHLVQATGFQVDIHRFGFLAPEIVKSIRTVSGEPRLGAGFESSVPGLHFLGSASDLSYGPLMRAIAGTTFSANAVAARATAGLDRKGTMTWGKTMEMLEQGIGMAPGLAGPSVRAAAVVGMVAPLLGVESNPVTDLVSHTNQTGSD